MVQRTKAKPGGKDWTKIETEYVAGTMSLKELAKRKRVSYSTISKKASEGGWAAKRKDFRAKVADRALARARERGVQRLADLMAGTEKLLDAAIETLNDQLQFQRHIVTEGAGEGISETTERTFDKRDTKAMKDMAAVIKECAGLLRDYYGIYTPAQEMSQELVRARIRALQEDPEEHSLTVRFAEDEDTGDS